MHTVRQSLIVVKTVLSLLAFTVPTVVLVTSFATSAQAQVFQSIDVDGNQRIASATIRSIAAIPTGSEVTPGQINGALQRLYDTGFFEQVEIMPAGAALKISVVENPTINRIAIEGNRRVDDDALLPLLGSRPSRTFSVSQTEADVRTILEAYAVQGRIAAEVQPFIIRRSDNRVDLVFEVLEGRITEIDNISFIGNREFSDRRLRRVLETKEAGALSGLFSNDTFIEDRLSFDAQRLREFYFRRGYLDFTVLASSAELSRERNAFLLNFRVQEGQQYRYGEVTFRSEVADADVEPFEKLAFLRAGNIYNPEEVEAILARLDNEADGQGLAFARSDRTENRDDDGLVVNIEFVLSTGPRAFVERIDIEGNSTTLDRVIRRQFETVEGDVLNDRQIREANDRIQSLGYFSSVDVSTREGSSEEQQIIDVNVQERATGSLSFGASYSSSGGTALTLNIVERNFLGRGQTVGVGFSTASENTNYNFQFVEPAVLDRDLRFSLNVSYTDESPSSVPLDNAATDVSVNLNFPISDRSRLGVGAFYSADEIVVRSGSTTTEYIDADAGDYSTSGLRFTYTIDRRNSTFRPTGGTIFRITQDLAGLSGNQEYSRTVASLTTFRSFYNEQLIFSAELEAGVLEAFNNSYIPSLNRFNLGGDSLRGFENFGIGPRDDLGDPLGGTKYAVARFEASFPLGLPEEIGIFGGVFLDVGTLWDLDQNPVGAEDPVDDDADLRAAAGVSIFWETAIGPLRFNFSRAIEKQPQDKTEDFRFTVDARF